jgi:hypothetical protein
MGISFTIAAGPRQRIHSQVRVRGTHNHNLLSQIRDSANLEGQVPVFIFLRNKVARLYLQGSLFVAYYDSQGCGGGIRPRLHTGVLVFEPFFVLITSRHGTRRKRRFPKVPLLLRVDSLPWEHVCFAVVT